MDAAPRASPPWGRLLLTGALPLLLCVAQQILLPGLDPGKHGALPGMLLVQPLHSQFSIVALGLLPVMIGFVCTEVIAAVVPRWRRLRDGDLAGRRSLRHFALCVSLLCALAQAGYFARNLQLAAQSFGASSLFSDGVLRQTLAWFVPLATLTLVAGTCALLVLGRAIERHALGGGLSVLVMTLSLLRLADLLHAPNTEAAWQAHSWVELALGAILALGVLAAVTLALQRPVTRGALVRLPTCGLLPLIVTATVLQLPSALVSYLGQPLPGWLLSLAPGTSSYWVLYAVLTVSLGALLSRLFNGAAQQAEETTSASSVATGWSLTLLLVVAAGTETFAQMVGLSLDLVMLAAVPAVVLDLAAEWRVRKTHGELALVFTCAHLPAANLATQRLEAAGVPAIIRSLHHRSLWHLYAPYLEMDVLVPVALSAQAQELLSGRPAAAEPKRARPPAGRPPLRAGIRWALAGLAGAWVGLLGIQRYLLRVDRPTWQLVYQGVSQDLSSRGPQDQRGNPEHLLRADAKVIKDRLHELAIHGATVRVVGQRIVVGLPRLARTEHARLQRLLGRPAQLTMRFVADGTDYMRRLGAYADNQKTSHPALVVGYDAWTVQGSGEQRTDVYLKSADRNMLQSFIAALPPELTLPPGHSLLLEQVNKRGEEASQPMFRTYLVAQDVLLSAEDINNAEVAWNVESRRPEVSLTFLRAGSARFEAATGANVGRRVAIILDNEVMSAPTIEGRISGGASRITLGGYLDEAELQQEAHDLVAVLLGGSLPMPLTFVREEPVTD